MTHPKNNLNNPASCPNIGVRYILPTNVINLSKIPLTPDELKLLSLGLSFVPTPSLYKFEPETLISDFRTLKDTYMANYTHSASCNAQGTLNHICAQLEENFTPIKVRHTKDNLSPRLRKPLNLSKDTTRLITKADKGDVTVVMDVDQLHKTCMETPL